MAACVYEETSVLLLQDAKVTEENIYLYELLLLCSWSRMDCSSTVWPLKQDTLDERFCTVS